jgi:phosphatidylserine decarboxylase
MMDSKMSSCFSTLFVPIHKEGRPFIAAFAGVTLFLFLMWQPLGWLGVLLTLWCIYFFRDPERVSPSRENLILSPADGRVILMGKVQPPQDLEMGSDPLMRVSIFMNVFNVHVNRVPASGKIEHLAYRPGQFLNASLDKASVDNERMAVKMTLENGQNLAFVQIAGLVARRIKCDLLASQQVQAGERFGIIRFGSRMDVYFPEGIEPLVSVGQTMIAGETVLAEINA